MEKIEKLLLFIIGQFKGEHLEGGDANTESEEIMDKLKVHCKHVLADRQLGEAGEGDGGGSLKVFYRSVGNLNSYL